MLKWQNLEIFAYIVLPVPDFNKISPKMYAFGPFYRYPRLSAGHSVVTRIRPGNLRSDQTCIRIRAIPFRVGSEYNHIRTAGQLTRLASLFGWIMKI